MTNQAGPGGLSWRKGELGGGRGNGEEEEDTVGGPLPSGVLEGQRPVFVAEGGWGSWGNGGGGVGVGTFAVAVERVHAAVAGATAAGPAVWG